MRDRLAERESGLVPVEAAAEQDRQQSAALCGRAQLASTSAQRSW